MNSIRKMRLSGTNKPNLKSTDQIMPIQLTETVIQFMEETVMQLTPTLTKDPQVTEDIDQCEIYLFKNL